MRRDDRVDGLRGIAALATVAASIPLLLAGRPTLNLVHSGLAVFAAMLGFLLYRPFTLQLVREDRKILVQAFLRNRMLRLIAPMVVAYLVSRLLAVPMSVDTWSFSAVPSCCLALPALFWLAGHLNKTPEAQVKATTVPAALLVGVGLVLGVLAGRSALIISAFGLGMLGAVAVTSTTARRVLRRSVWQVRRSALLFALSALAALPAAITLGFVIVPVALAAASIIVLVSLPGRRLRSVLSAVLAAPPLRYVGRRAYSLLLWHHPVTLAVFDRLHESRAVQGTAAAALTWLAAELTYRLIETPILRQRRRALRPVERRLPSLPPAEDFDAIEERRLRRNPTLVDPEDILPGFQAAKLPTMRERPAAETVDVVPVGMPPCAPPDYPRTTEPAEPAAPASAQPATVSAGKHRADVPATE